VNLRTKKERHQEKVTELVTLRKEVSGERGREGLEVGAG